MKSKSHFNQLLKDLTRKQNNIDVKPGGGGSKDKKKKKKANSVNPRRMSLFLASNVAFPREQNGQHGPLKRL